jgi:hypothetical protein
MRRAKGDRELAALHRATDRHFSQHLLSLLSDASLLSPSKRIAPVSWILALSPIRLDINSPPPIRMICPKMLSAMVRAGINGKDA